MPDIDELIWDLDGGRYEGETRYEGDAYYPSEVGEWIPDNDKHAQAYEELKKIGPSAIPNLLKALNKRRAGSIQGLMHDYGSAAVLPLLEFLEKKGTYTLTMHQTLGEWTIETLSGFGKDSVPVMEQALPRLHTFYRSNVEELIQQILRRA